MWGIPIWRRHGLLRQMLAGQSLSVGADDFRPVARQVLSALDELDEAIHQAQPPNVP